MLADVVEVVIGVDTHKHSHTAGVVVAATGAAGESATVATDPDGYAELLAMAERHSGLRAWAIEGTGGYGAGLARFLAERGVASWRPDLLNTFGVGPIVAAVVLCAWPHPRRCRNDAAFANLAGVAPIPASSGQTVRYRLNRCGDRQLNRALHVIILNRLRYDPDTRAYADRRRQEGKTDREIRRCLKRYIARQLYRQLEAGHP